MKQKFIQIADLKLAYLDKNEDKKNILFFIHGNSLSSNSWIEQLNSPLFQDYRLIAIDLPGHGESEASLNPAQDYNIPALGLIIANAIKTLAGNNPYLIVAISLGTNILAESLAFDLQPTGIVLAGSCLVGGKYNLDSFAYPNTNIHVVFTEQAPEDAVEKYASQVMTNRKLTNVNEFIADYYKVKFPFRSALMTSIQEQKYNDQIALIQAIEKPILMIFGKDEQIVNPDYLDDAPLNFWQNKIFKIPGASHLVHSDQPETFNELLGDYARQMF